MKRVAIITSSDMGYQGRREDLSGPAIKEIVEREGYQVVSMDILPDDRSMLSKRMVEIADENQAELILTTGGTGFSPRDVMPEATEDIIERKVPGGDPCLQHDHHKPRHAQPRHSWDPQADPDYQSPRQPQGGERESGIHYWRPGTWYRDHDRGSRELCPIIVSLKLYHKLTLPSIEAADTA